MTELEKFIAELQYHADNGVTEIHPYISRDDDNWESKMWIIKPLTTDYESGKPFNFIEIGMEEFIEQEDDYESEDQTDSLYYQSQEDYYNL